MKKLDSRREGGVPIGPFGSATATFRIPILSFVALFILQYMQIVDYSSAGKAVFAEHGDPYDCVSFN